MAKKNLKSLAPFINVYDTSYKPNVISDNKAFPAKIAAAKNDDDKAHILLIGDIGWPIGCHLWYLKLHDAIYKDLINEIIARKLWATPLASYSSFEDLYYWLNSWMKRPYINQLAIYDVALHIINAQGATSLLPRDVVYVHAKPMLGLKDAYNKGYIAYKPKGNKMQIDRAKLPEFNPMDSYYIESFLCQVGKGKIVI